ncbi:MAG: GntR family transcriptional regulator [Maritimibacter sp.]
MAESKGSTHTKRATYELRQRIIQGEISGGTRLYEVALAEELDISRTPVREAMSRLAEEGLARGDVAAGRRGAFGARARRRLHGAVLHLSRRDRRD